MWVEERREGRVLLKDEVWCGWIESLLLGQLRWLRLEQRGRIQLTGQFGATDCFLSLIWHPLLEPPVPRLQEGCPRKHAFSQRVQTLPSFPGPPLDFSYSCRSAGLSSTRTGPASPSVPSSRLLCNEVTDHRGPILQPGK